MPAAAPLPPVTQLKRNNTHRLIPSQYSERADSVLSRIADDDDHLRDLFDLDIATNDRALAENSWRTGIGPEELVFGVPYFRTVNAAFTHAHPMGSRFNGPERGAWYAGFELRTSQAEVIFHKTVEFAEINRFDQSVTYDDYLADFTGQFHDLRDAAGFEDCLADDSYVASQAMADRLMAEDSQGIIYPSVRRAGGTCLACFRPALVYNVRRNARYRISWDDKPTPRVSVETRF